jgi:hypothetical protein
MAQLPRLLENDDSCDVGDVMSAFSLDNGNISVCSCAMTRIYSDVIEDEEDAKRNAITAAPTASDKSSVVSERTETIRGTGLQFLSGDRLYSLRFSWFTSAPPGNFRVLSQLKLDYSRFVQHHSQNLSEGTEKYDENSVSIDGVPTDARNKHFGIQGGRLPELCHAEIRGGVKM